VINGDGDAKAFSSNDVLRTDSFVCLPRCSSRAFRKRGIVTRAIVERQKDELLQSWVGRQKKSKLMVNMGVEPRTLALLAPRSKPTELIDLIRRLCSATMIDDLCSCGENRIQYGVQLQMSTRIPHRGADPSRSCCQQVELRMAARIHIVLSRHQWLWQVP
jgi:hypothetical protein